MATKILSARKLKNSVNTWDTYLLEGHKKLSPHFQQWFINSLNEPWKRQAWKQINPSLKEGQTLGFKMFIRLFAPPLSEKQVLALTYSENFHLQKWSEGTTQFTIKLRSLLFRVISDPIIVYKLSKVLINQPRNIEIFLKLSVKKCLKLRTAILAKNLYLSQLLEALEAELSRK